MGLKTTLFIKARVFPLINHWGLIAMVKRDIKIVNIVISTSLQHDIPLEKMAATLSNTEYNPEQFPGLVYKLSEGGVKATFLLFSNGKVVCTGTKSEEQANKALDQLVE